MRATVAAALLVAGIGWAGFRLRDIHRTEALYRRAARARDDGMCERARVLCELVLRSRRNHAGARTLLEELDIIRAMATPEVRMWNR